MTHTAPHPLAGCTITVNPAAALFRHPDTRPVQLAVEDWTDRAFGRSWMDMDGNPACLSYAMRSAIGNLPVDNEVVYGKDASGIGHLVHVSEIAGAGA